MHRVVGPPGIVLIGEGNPNRLRSLLTTEHRKHQRVASETPIHEVVVGDSEGAVPLPQADPPRHQARRAIKPAEMTDVLAAAQGARRQPLDVPMPKGPVPTSMKGSRQNMRGR